MKCAWAHGRVEFQHQEPQETAETYACAWCTGEEMTLEVLVIFLPSSASLSRVLRGYVYFQWFGRYLPDGSKLNNFVRKMRYFNSDLSALR